VIGNVAPDTAKPVPVSVAELIVTGAVPADVKVTDCVAVVLTATLPKATVVALMLSVGTAGFSCRTYVLETLPALASSFAVCVDLTGDTLAVNPALIALAGTDTVAGNATAEFVLNKLTLRPPADLELSVIEQATVSDPVTDALLQDNALSATAGEPAFVKM
jgi:hypothetical protein